MRQILRQLFSDPWLVARYFITALSGTAFSSVIFFVLLWLGLPYWLSGGIAQISGIIYNFTFYQHLVFGLNTKGYFIRYLMLQLGLYVLHIGGQQQMAKAGYSNLECFIILMPIFMIIGYAVTRLIVFPPAKPEELDRD